MPTSPARTALVSLGLLVAMNGPVIFITDRVLEGEQGWEEPFTRDAFIALAVAALAAVLLDPLRPEERQLTSQSPLATGAIVVFTAWAVMSSFWSLAPELTRGRSVVYIGLAALAWLVADLDSRSLRLALGVAVGIALSASVLAVALSDAVGLDRNEDWRGVFTSRNSLAPVAALAVAVGLGWVIDQRGLRRLAAASLGIVGLIAMFESGSRTPALALTFSLFVASVVVLARMGRDRFGARASRVALLVSALGSVATVGVVVAVWSEPTFAQRRTIWSLVWDQIGERPIHGHGWFSIWTVPEFTSQHLLLQRGSAHGSFLEVWLGLGIVGVLPFVVIAGLAVLGVARDAWNKPGALTWTWLSVVVFLVIENITESFVLWFSYNWVLLMAAALRAGVGLRRPPGRQTRDPSEAATVSAR